MKKIAQLIIPTLIFSLLYATTLQAQTSTIGVVTLQYSSNLDNWENIIDITSYVQEALNNGQKEVHLDITIGIEDKNVMVEKANDPNNFIVAPFEANINNDLGFFRLSYQEIGGALIDKMYKNVILKPQCSAGWIIGILLLIVAGIIVYLLIKTCKKLLDDDDDDGGNNG